jgi:hypothetical protein
MGFDIRKYIEENKFEVGSIKKEVGDATFKGGHNDLRKTTYDVKFTEDGKLDLYTHKEIMTEDKKLTESAAFNRHLYNKLEEVIKLLNNLDITDLHEFSEDGKKISKVIEKFIKKAKL